MEDEVIELDMVTEGDARAQWHAEMCGTKPDYPGHCFLECCCWCHGFTHHMDGSLRPDHEFASPPQGDPTPSGGMSLDHA